jgi:hypothetical protein
MQRLFHEFEILTYTPIEQSQQSMPKAKLPDWKNEPLKFAFSPDEALRRGALARPRKGWGKAITTGRKARR